MQITQNIFRILIAACIVLFIGLIGQQIYISQIESGIADATPELKEAKSAHAEAQRKNDELQQAMKDEYIEWRNAQGRLALLGSKTGKVCYLTFDGGPDDELTPKNLQILTEKNAVATWFCLADVEACPYLDLGLCKTIEEQGSAVGIYNWDQDLSYSFYKGSVDNYFTSDFDKAKAALEDTIGHEIKIMRFAGGSSTIGYYNSDNAKALPRAVLERGYQYFDWNVMARDSEPSLFVNGSTPVEKIVYSILDDAKYYADIDSPICVLMHDGPGKQTTTEALPTIIDNLRALGYEFATLDFDSPGFYQTVIME